MLVYSINLIAKLMNCSQKLFFSGKTFLSIFLILVNKPFSSCICMDVLSHKKQHLANHVNSQVNQSSTLNQSSNFNTVKSWKHNKYNHNYYANDYSKVTQNIENFNQLIVNWCSVDFSLNIKVYIKCLKSSFFCKLTVDFNLSYWIINIIH